MKLRLFSSAFLAALLLGCVKAQAPQEIDDDLDMIDSIDYIDEYGVNHGPGIKVGIHIWSPVNCGYHATDYKYGKLYQWGRLYGQGFGDDATVPIRWRSVMTRVMQMLYLKAPMIHVMIG